MICTILTIYKTSISLQRIHLLFSVTEHKVLCEAATYLLVINLLKPTGYVTHQQFNIQQLYVLPTLYLCVLYLFENKQRLVPLTA